MGRYTDGRPRGCAPADSGTQARPSASSLTPIEVKAIVDKYCVGCHNERTKSGGLVLNTVDFTKVAANAEPLAKVVRKLGTGSMPPVGMPRPDKETHDALVSWLARELDRAAAAKPDPGRVILRRFRTEYANAIRDLLDLNIDVSALLPVDNSSYGFDNIGDVLGISPVLMERYVIAARRISAVAVGDAAEIPVIAETYRVRPDTAQDKHLEGLPLGTRGGLAATARWDSGSGRPRSWRRGQLTEWISGLLPIASAAALMGSDCWPDELRAN